MFSSGIVVSRLGQQPGGEGEAALFEKGKGWLEHNLRANETRGGSKEEIFLLQSPATH